MKSLCDVGFRLHNIYQVPNVGLLFIPWGFTGWFVKRHISVWAFGAMRDLLPLRLIQFI